MRIGDWSSDVCSSDLALVRHQSPRQCRFTNETDPAFGTARGAIRQQAHAFKFDTDVGDRECDRLAMADRLAERHALVDVWNQIIERRLCGADGERAPCRSRPPDAVALRRGIRARKSVM